MFTRPEDIDETELRAAVSRVWGIDLLAITYAPVGFGSHHWVAAGADDRWFLTVDDLTACLESADDTHDAVFGRLDSAFRCAALLGGEGGLEFVVAPVPTEAGEIVYRFDDRYSAVLHPFLDAVSAGGDDDKFTEERDRQAVVALVGRLHGATGVVQDVAIRDDLVVPLRRELEEAITRTTEAWDTGPYGERARSLLASQARDLERLFPAFDVLARRVDDEPERYVITHGEPNAQNVMVAGDRHYLIDWESARLAAPERDLWDLAAGDPTIVTRYEANTGTGVRGFALDAYCLWYDLFEIAGYIDGFRKPHGDTADAAESWKNLQYFLRPVERWPQLL